MRVRLLPDERWSQLVDTTLEVLELVPPYDVVLDDIATTAGVSRGLVYRYFSGIDDLLGHARRRFFTALQAELERVLDLDREPLDQLREVIAATVHFAAAHRGTFCNLVDGGLPHRAEDDLANAAILRLTSQLRPSPDALLVARATAALIQTGIVSWLRDEVTDAETVIDLLFSLAARGLHDHATTPAKNRRRPDETLGLDSSLSQVQLRAHARLRTRAQHLVLDGLGATPRP